MSKGTRWIKRVTALLLVLLLSIESFAAVVSDNDGSAFITKAEFDSLKNNFQSQIDSYNTSLDSKIDGAIAAYLAGIRVSVKNESQILTPSWKYVNFLNEIIKPEFAFPNLRLNNSYALYYFNGGTSGQSNTSNNKLVSYNLVARYNKTWNNSETNLRPLVNVTGTEANHKKYIWNGIANRYVETIVATNIGNMATSDFSWMDADINYFRFYVTDPAYLHAFGYNENFLDKTDFWKGSFKYQYRTSGSSTWNTGQSFNPSNKQSSNVLQVKLQKIKVGTEEIEKQCEHMVQYKAETTWPVSNETFTNTFRACSYNSKTNNNYGSTATKNNYGKFLAEVKYYTDSATQVTNGTISLNYEYSNTNKVPSVGYIGEIRSDAIYQFKDEIKTTLDKKEWKLEDISLEQGLPLHAIRAKYDVDWECEFDGVVWTNASGNVTTDDKREVDLYFSYGPFKDKFETDYPAYVAKDKDGKNINYITTKDRKSKIKISGTKDDILYVKCLPHFESTESALKDKYWNVELNLKNSNTIYWTNNS